MHCVKRMGIKGVILMSLSIEKVMELITLRDQEKLTWKALTKYFPKYSPNALRKTYYRHAKPTVPKGVKVLVVDVETAPLEAFVWGLHEQNVGLEQIKTDWSIMSFSAKWLGAPESEIFYCDNRNEADPRDDRKLLKVIHSLLDEADICLTQNGIKFDTKKLNARFILNGMPPVTSYRNIDTLRIAKKHFGFTSNKLAYMTSQLCTKYKKQDHSDFPGMKLWIECLKGNIKAWKSMEVYNKFDILSLEELYFVLAPWDKTIQFNVYSDDAKERCTCGNEEFQTKGYIYTNSAKYQRYVCTNCQKEYKDNYNLLAKTKRKAMLK